MSVTIYDSAVAAFLHDPAGPVGRDLLRRGAQVAAASRQLCPVGQRKPDWRGHIDTGPHLRDTIAEERPAMHDGSLAVLVAARSPYAIYVHEPTRPHVIEPRNTSVLRFEVSGGQIVFSKHVDHPGTTGQRFLTEALPVAFT